MMFFSQVTVRDAVAHDHEISHDTARLIDFLSKTMEPPHNARNVD
jgi:hypothetical protein